MTEAAMSVDKNEKVYGSTKISVKRSIMLYLSNVPSTTGAIDSLSIAFQGSQLVKQRLNSHSCRVCAGNKPLDFYSLYHQCQVM